LRNPRGVDRMEELHPIDPSGSRKPILFIILEQLPRTEPQFIPALPNEWVCRSPTRNSNYNSCYAGAKRTFHIPGCKA
jgi:hypothetical protein